MKKFEDLKLNELDRIDGICYQLESLMDDLSDREMYPIPNRLDVYNLLSQIEEKLD